MMEQPGFIRDILDVKVLILYVCAKALYPLSLQKIYELSYQDDKLSYFDVGIAVPQMVQSGHLMQNDNGEYLITDRGRDAQSVTEDCIAYPVLQRAKNAVERFNRDIRRDSLIHTEILPRENGDFSVVMGLDDEVSNLMTLELLAPNQHQARVLEKAFHQDAEHIFHMVMTALLDTAENKENADI